MEWFTHIGLIERETITYKMILTTYVRGVNMDSL